MTKKSAPNDDHLGIGCPITRRDFVGGTLIGAGAALTASCAPGRQENPFAPSNSPWTGFGGVGDYAWSNGNTEKVRDAAHTVRDGVFDESSGAAPEDSYDLVIVGGGFTGITAACEFFKKAKPGKRALLLENHAMPGGEAKQNEIDVDGQIVIGPQGSNGAAVPNGPFKGSVYASYWEEIGMPGEIDRVPLAGGAEKYHLASDHYAPMVDEIPFPTGYFFRGHGWARNPMRVDFANTPWSSEIKAEMADFIHNRRDGISNVKDVDRWLDTISYQQLLRKAGYGEAAERFVNPLLGVGNFGVCADAVSALAVKGLSLPGTVPQGEEKWDTSRWLSFPGGNAAVLRGMLRILVPAAFAGSSGTSILVSGPLSLNKLDQPTNRVRIRLNATAVRVEHDGDPKTAGSAIVTYLKDGKPHRVRAKAVVMGIGGWVARRVVRDLPDSYQAAYQKMLYGPVLTINVAVRNWRFIDRLGFTNMRWFDGIGWHLTVRQDVDLSGKAAPFTPDSPTMLTFYTPVLAPGIAPAQQGAVARQRLMDTPYLNYEKQVRAQMTEMFGAAGFDDRRDIAGIVLNRWGHAYSAPQPGFFYGKGEQEGTPTVLRRPHGRIMFAHSEFEGRMNMISAMAEGARAADQALAMI